MKQVYHMAAMIANSERGFDVVFSLTGLTTVCHPKAWLSITINHTYSALAATVAFEHFCNKTQLNSNRKIMIAATMFNSFNTVKH